LVVVELQITQGLQPRNSLYGLDAIPSEVEGLQGAEVLKVGDGGQSVVIQSYIAQLVE